MRPRKQAGEGERDGETERAEVGNRAKIWKNHVVIPPEVQKQDLRRDMTA